MISDHDISLAARAMIYRYGSTAWIEAAERAEDLLASGDLDGKAMWLRMMAAIEKLLADKPAPVETVQ